MARTYYNTVNGRMISQKKNGVRTNFHTDALGSITTTTVNGAVENTYRYKPYGETLAKTGTAEDPRFLWTGDTGSRRTEAKASEQYNRRRQYGNFFACWSTQDPIWPDERAYTYSGNPATLKDPFGLKIELTQECKCYTCKDIDNPLPNFSLIRDFIDSGCKKIWECWNSSTCRNSVITCINDFRPGTGFEFFKCIVNRCNPGGKIARVMCGQTICDLGKGCAYHTIGCNIQVCIDNDSEYCGWHCRPPKFPQNPILNWYMPVVVSCPKIRCNRASFGPGEDMAGTLFHELGHCCGSGSHTGGNTFPDDVEDCFIGRI